MKTTHEELTLDALQQMAIDYAADAKRRREEQQRIDAAHQAQWQKEMIAAIKEQLRTRGNWPPVAIDAVDFTPITAVQHDRRGSVPLYLRLPDAAPIRIHVALHPDRARVDGPYSNHDAPINVQYPGSVFAQGRNAEYYEPGQAEIKLMSDTTWHTTRTLIKAYAAAMAIAEEWQKAVEQVKQYIVDAHAQEEKPPTPTALPDRPAHHLARRALELTEIAATAIDDGEYEPATALALLANAIATAANAKANNTNAQANAHGIY